MAPITIKENTDQAGRATNHEVLDFEDRFAEDDSPLVKNLLNAGATPP
jgi:Asp-tRNA(Asn)/Glu-tRNA(Gln) amidotransferase A subunit family amidase